MNRRHFHAGMAGAILSAVLPGCAGIATQSKGDQLATVDTHAHIFQRGLKLANVRRYAPDYDATLGDYLDLMDRHGIARGVLVQPSFLGTDNSFMLAGLRDAPGRLRGIAVVDPDTPSIELKRMNAAGVVGIRLNLVGGASVPDLSSAPWRTLLKRVADLGWQVEVHREARDLPQILPSLLNAGVNVVVDHFGRPAPALGVNDPGFRFLLDAGASRRIWVKLSATYRNGADGAGEKTALAAIPLLRNAFGMERLMWGSDWPHTQFEKSMDYDRARKALDIWLPNPDERKVVLVDTPTSLFRFPAGLA
jgi:predicted TIM-barrel fold metal-dependent hydrolase